MNQITYIILTSLFICPTGYAIDLYIDTPNSCNALCKKLHTALEQKKAIDDIQAIWHLILAHDSLSTTEITSLANQVTKYTQKQKELLEAENAMLHDTKYNRARITRGFSQGLLLAYCTTSPLFPAIEPFNLPLSAIGAWCLNTLNHRGIETRNAGGMAVLISILITEFALRLGITIYLLKKLYYLVYARKHIAQQIKNCDAIIEFIQPWASR